MDLRGIRERITLARARLEKINPDIGCHLVVMVGGTQLDPALFEVGHIDLGKTPEIFVADAATKHLLACRDKILRHQAEISSLQKRTDTEARRAIAKVIQQHDIRIAREREKRDAILADCRAATWKVEQLVRTRGAQRIKPHAAAIAKQTERFAVLLRQVAFHDAWVELRFHTLDIGRIQAIKEHPIVQAIGETPLNKASIRVVLA